MENDNFNITDPSEQGASALNADTSADTSAADVPAESREETSQYSDTPAAGEPEAPKYVWTYESQLNAEKDRKKKDGKRGALIYAIIVTSVFAVCFAILAAVLAFGYISGFTTRTETVYVDRVVYVRQDDGSSGILTVQEIAAKVTPSTVAILVTKDGSSGSGTGIVLDKNGYISTDYHVIDGAKTIKVSTQDGREFPAELVGGDEMSDVAVLKVDPDSFELIPAEFGDSDKVLIGDSVVAIGNAGGVELFGSVTTGVVSGIRNLKFYDSNGLVEKTMNFIQTNAELNPGVSGGPICDEYGRVIGVVVMKLLRDNEIEGVGFAVPSNGAKKVIDEIIKTGHYSGNDIATKGVSLGITIANAMKDAEIEVDNAGTKVKAGADGVMVVSITDENSSAYGYLKLYDIITAVEGKAVTQATDVRNVLANKKPGDTITLTVFRDGKTMEIIVPLK